jgi:hypothetical protein
MYRYRLIVIPSVRSVSRMRGEDMLFSAERVTKLCIISKMIRILAQRFRQQQEFIINQKTKEYV